MPECLLSSVSPVSAMLETSTGSPVLVGLLTELRSLLVCDLDGCGLGHDHIQHLTIYAINFKH